MFVWSKIILAFLLVCYSQIFASSLDSKTFRAHLRQKAESTVARINQIQSKWTAKLNPRFAEMTDDELKGMLGVILESDSHSNSMGAMNLKGWREHHSKSSSTVPMPSTTTEMPTTNSTYMPSTNSTYIPSTNSTYMPSTNSTYIPSTNSTYMPSTNSTYIPSTNSTYMPSTNSTYIPSTNSTYMPSTNSTYIPSTNSTYMPSTNSTYIPSTNSTYMPSTNSTYMPSTNSTYMPSTNSTYMPSTNSTYMPSTNSTYMPSTNSTYMPSTTTQMPTTSNSTYQPSTTIVPVPEDFFDAREKWPECEEMMNKIQDQSRCGSCWAVSSASVMQDRICIGSKGKVQVDISAEDMISCPSGTDGCNGGSVLLAFERWESDGYCTGSGYLASSGCKPYPFPPHSHVNMYPTPPCAQNCTNPNYTISYDEDKYFGRKRISLYKADQEDIKQAIRESGPVVATFAVYNDFYHYYSGVYERTKGSKFAGNHAVRVIGWGVENGTPYWMVANSWNADWGDNGWFKIIRGKNECDFESRGVHFADALI